MNEMSATVRYVQERIEEMLYEASRINASLAPHRPISDEVKSGLVKIQDLMAEIDTRVNPT